MQLHFHAPSEHAVGGKKARMEVHFVHLSEAGCGDGTSDPRPLVVLGGFIEAEDGVTELAKLFPEGLPTDKDDTPVLVDNVNLAALLASGQPTWRYEGGLTAPSTACNWFGSATPQLISGEFPEAVHWFLYDKKSIRRFEELFPEGNSRPLKEIGEREVYSRGRCPRRGAGDRTRRPRVVSSSDERATAGWRDASLPWHRSFQGGVRAEARPPNASPCHFFSGISERR